MKGMGKGKAMGTGTGAGTNKGTGRAQGTGRCKGKGRVSLKGKDLPVGSLAEATQQVVLSNKLAFAGGSTRE